MSFPRYPKYKDSGVEWLGEVPEHWGIVPLKAVASHNDDILSETTPPETDLLYVDISSVDANRGIVAREALTFATAPSRARRLVRHGDVIVSTVRTYLKAISPIRNPEQNLIVSTGFAVVRPRARLDSGYLGYLASAPYFVEQVISRSTGVSYPAINASELVGVAVPLPPTPEQEAIAAFLESETTKIDELVAEQQRLMELLKEKRRAVISHAVTKGLNPDAPMKPSGVEWLGEVPAHWEVERVKTISSFVTSGPRGWSDSISESGSLFVQSGELNDSLGIEFQSAKRVQVGDDAESDRTRLCAGDVLVCITGAKTGNVAICSALPETAYINQHLCLIRPSGEILPAFLGMTLKSESGKTHFELSQRGLKDGLTLESVREAVVALPPLVEQADIVAQMQATNQMLDALSEAAMRAIDVLHERRSALISAAVTGQIDVRRLATAEAA